jgi:hypothetical protein
MRMRLVVQFVLECVCIIVAFVLVVIVIVIIATAAHPLVEMKKDNATSMTMFLDAPS